MSAFGIDRAVAADAAAVSELLRAAPSTPSDQRAELVYQRATRLATRHLQLARSTLGDRAGTTGAAVLAIEHILAPEFVDACWVGRRPRPPPDPERRR